MRRWKRVWGLMAMAAVGLLGCHDDDRETYSILPFKAGCHAGGPWFCLQGIQPETGAGALFKEIEGFTFRWGTRQTVRISQQEVTDPAPDALSVRYVVEEVVETERMPADASFDLYISRDYLTGNRTSGYSLIDSTRVTCATSAVCAELEQRLTSSEKFELDMTYPDTEGDPLIIRSLP
jgi:hypothetical protein